MTEPVVYKKPLSVGQVATVCHVSKKTVLNWIYSGALKAFTTYGGHYRVWPVNIRKFLDSAGMDIPFEYVDDTHTQLLIIDDDKSYTQMLRSLITAEVPEAEITSTDDGYEGLLLIGELKPRLLILDIMMPKIDGLKVLDLLKSRKVEQDMKILIASGYLTEEMREKLSNSVVDQIIDKTSEVENLVRAIAGLLKGEVAEAV